jgi:hypothetical protein
MADYVYKRIEGIKKEIIKTIFLIRNCLLKDWVYIIFLFILAFLFYYFIHSPGHFADPDSFYHVKIVELMFKKGIIKDFPYLPFTDLKNYYIDHHFFYHILLMPFVFLFDSFWGVQMVTILFAAIFIVLFYLFLKRNKIPYANILPFFLMFSPSFSFRISLPKAGSFSIILIFLSFYCIFFKRKFLLFLLAFLYVWSYGGFPLLLFCYIIYIFSDFWFLFIKNFNYIINRFLIYKPIIKLFFKTFFNPKHLKMALIIISGIGLGLVLNPYFPKNFYFYWVQIIKIAVINYRSLIAVGGEWYPYDFFDLMGQNSAIFVFVVPLFFSIFFFIKKISHKTWFFFWLSFCFFIFTLRSCRHAEYLIPFCCTFIGFCLKDFTKYGIIEKFKNEIKQKFKRHNILCKILFVYFIVSFLFIFIMGSISLKKSLKGVSEKRFVNVSNYIKKNIQENEIIFHTDWDEFPYLFYHNHQNRYIAGLDPTFMYNYDKKKYKLWRDIVQGKVKKDLRETIKDNFKTNYVLIDLKGYLSFDNVIKRNGNFQLLYEDKESKLYKF